MGKKLEAYENLSCVIAQHSSSPWRKMAEASGWEGGLKERKKTRIMVMGPLGALGVGIRSSFGTEGDIRN